MEELVAILILLVIAHHTPPLLAQTPDHGKETNAGPFEFVTPCKNSALCSTLRRFYLRVLQEEVVRLLSFPREGALSLTLTREARL